MLLLTDNEKKIIDEKMGYIKRTIKGLQNYDNPCKLADEIDKWLYELAGYPKETFDDHWCYILKDYGTKYLIIPTTSIKVDSGECNPLYEMDIIDKTPVGRSRLHFTKISRPDIDTREIVYYDEGN